MGVRGMGFRENKNCVTTVEVYGIEPDMGSERTNTISASDSCVWDEEFSFTLRSPELAVLLLTLCHEDKWKDDLIGQVAIAVDNLRLGKFVVPLLDRTGAKHPKGTALLVELSANAVPTSMRYSAPTITTTAPQPQPPGKQNRSSKGITSEPLPSPASTISKADRNRSSEDGSGDRSSRGSAVSAAETASNKGKKNSVTKEEPDKASAAGGAHVRRASEGAKDLAPTKSIRASTNSARKESVTSKDDQGVTALQKPKKVMFGKTTNLDGKAGEMSDASSS
jgi:hypothetical protein